MYSLQGEPETLSYFYLNVFDGTIALRRSLVGVPHSSFSVSSSLTLQQPWIYFNL